MNVPVEDVGESAANTIRPTNAPGTKGAVGPGTLVCLGRVKMLSLDPYAAAIRVASHVACARVGIKAGQAVATNTVTRVANFLWYIIAAPPKDDLTFV